MGPLDRFLSALFEPGEVAPYADSEPEDRRLEERIETDQPVGVEWISDQGELEKRTAIVRDFSDNGLSIVVDSRFSVGETLWLSKEGTPIRKAVVRHVERTPDGNRLGLVLIRHERRRQDRHPVNGKGVLSWSTSRGDVHTSDAIVRDANEFGLQVEIQSPIEVGIVAKLSGEHLECMGSTCYCTRVGESYYRAGIHLVGKPRRNVPVTVF